MDDRTFSVPDHVSVTEVGGELVLLDLKSGKYFGLNAVARIIWTALSEGKSLGVTIAQVRDRFGVSKAQVQADVANLVEDLIASGLLAEA